MHTPPPLLYCEWCGQEEEGWFLLCDASGGEPEHGCHLVCAGLDSVPKGEWRCYKHLPSEEGEEEAEGEPSNRIPCGVCGKPGSGFVQCDEPFVAPHGYHSACLDPPISEQELEGGYWRCPAHESEPPEPPRRKRKMLEYLIMLPNEEAAEGAVEATKKVWKGAGEAITEVVEGAVKAMVAVVEEAGGDDDSSAIKASPSLITPPRLP
jgi:hypothetical protein